MRRWAISSLSVTSRPGRADKRGAAPLLMAIRQRTASVIPPPPPLLLWLFNALPALAHRAHMAASIVRKSLIPLPSIFLCLFFFRAKIFNY